MSRSAVVVYATGRCPYCSGARSLLIRKGVGFTEIDVEADPALRQEMEERSNRRTVPQIFIGDVHVGGYDDLAGLECSGELDALLARVRAVRRSHE